MKTTRKGTCTFPGCERPYHSRGLCSGHDKQRLRGQELRTLQPRRIGCMVAGCERKHHGGGYCRLHGLRVKATGDPHGVLRIADGRERFETYFSRADGCWLWTGRLDQDGYGHFRQDYRRTGAHRFAYEYFVGPIPRGLVVDHLCRVRHCVRPDHLEPVTTQENFIRGVMAMEHTGEEYAAWLYARRERMGA